MKERIVEKIWCLLGDHYNFRRASLYLDIIGLVTNIYLVHLDRNDGRLAVHTKVFESWNLCKSRGMLTGVFRELPQLFQTIVWCSFTFVLHEFPSILVFVTISRFIMHSNSLDTAFCEVLNFSEISTCGHRASLSSRTTSVSLSGSRFVRDIEKILLIYFTNEIK